MSDEPTQPVVDEPKTPAVPGDAGTGARNEAADLDALMGQYEEGKTKPRPATPELPADTNLSDLDKLVDLKVARKYAERQAHEDVARLATEVSTEYGTTPRIAEGWLHMMARENPAINDAFEHRDTEPHKWKRIKDALFKKFGEEHKQSTINQSATEDREAVTAAVRGASTQAPPDKPPNFADMSDYEFQQYKAKMIRR